MNQAHRVVADRIRGEMGDLGRAVTRALRRWEHALRYPDEMDAYLEATALNLQSFYTGLERVFSLVAEVLDMHLPAGEAWHRDLLRQMTTSVPGIRPEVVSATTALQLDTVMRFRHLVRNTYAEKLLVSEMKEMVEPSSRRTRITPRFHDL